MKKFVIQKQILSIVLIMAMFTGLMPNFVMAETGSVAYDASYLEVPVFNQLTMANTTFYNTWARSGPFNLGPYFTSGNYGSTPEITHGGFNYGTYLMNANGHMITRYTWPIYDYYHLRDGPGIMPQPEVSFGYDNLANLIKGNQLQFNFQANICYDTHYNIPKHFKDRTAGIMATVKYGSYHNIPNALNSITELEYYYEDRNAGDEVGVLRGEGLWERFRGWTYDDGTFFLDINKTGCTSCGSSKIDKMSFALSDVIAPTISRIYSTEDIGGSTWNNNFKADETGYIQVEFNENIRFANDAAPEIGKYSLNFTLIDTINNQEYKSADATNQTKATLVALNGNKLTFKFTVPQTIDGKNTNFHIRSISDIQDIWSKEKEFDLTLLAGTKDNGRNPVVLGSPLNTYEEFTKTTSAITDIAGNPINVAGSNKNLSSYVYLDNLSPEIARISIKGNMITKDSFQNSQAEDWPADIDRSAVFAGVGDWIEFNVDYTEELRTAEGRLIDLAKTPGKLPEITATLNASKNGVPGVPIEIKAVSAENIKVGVDNNVDATRIIFEKLNIDADMLPDSEPAKQFYITGLSLGNDVVTDLRRNSTNNVAPGDMTVMPAEQEWLDNLSPVVAIELSPSPNSKYTPVVSADGKSFKLPITVTDKAPHDLPAFESGINGVSGSFGWLDESSGKSFPFKYYIGVGAEDTPSDEQYSVGNTSFDVNDISTFNFSQVKDNTQYLHIKLVDDVEYNINQSKLIFYPADYAGNVGEDEFAINYNADLVEPTQKLEKYQRSFDATASAGKFTADIAIFDTGAVDTVEYQFVPRVNNDSQPDDSAWKDYNMLTVADTTSFTASFNAHEELPTFTQGSLYEFDLWVKSTDTWGNASKPSLFRFTLDLTLITGDISISSGLDTPAPNPDVVINAPPKYQGSDPLMADMPATSLFMIKDKDTTNGYFIRAIPSTKDGSDKAIDILKGFTYYSQPEASNIPPTEADESQSPWYWAEVVEENGEYLFSNSFDIGATEQAGETAADKKRHQLAMMAACYYGALDITVLTAYGELPLIENIKYEVIPSQAEVDAIKIGEEKLFTKKIPLDNTSYKSGDSFEFKSGDADVTLMSVHAITRIDENNTSATYGKSYYYGDDENTPIAVFDGTIDPIVYNTLPLTKLKGQIAKETFQLKAANTDGLPTGSYAGIYTITIDTPLLPNGSKLRYDENLAYDDFNNVYKSFQYDPNTDPSRFAKTMAGVTIPFSIVPKAMAEWGLSGVDFEKSTATLYYHQRRSDIVGAWVLNDVVYQTSLAPSVNQVFRVPENVKSDRSGYYSFVIELVQKDGRTFKKEYCEIFIGSDKLSDFGVKSYETRAFIKYPGTHPAYLSQSADVITSENGYFNELLLGSLDTETVGVELDLKFERYSKDDTLGDTWAYGKRSNNEVSYINYIPDAFYRVWNDADPNWQKDKTINAKWNFGYIDVAIVKSAAEINDQSYLGVDWGASTVHSKLMYGTLPIIHGERNIINYQMRLESGEMSAVKQLIINTSDVAPTLSVAFEPDNLAEGTYTNKAQAYIAEAFSPNGAVKLYYTNKDYGFEEIDIINNPVIQLQTEDAIFAPNSLGSSYRTSQKFAAVDAIGNVTLVEKNIPWLDTAPVDLEYGAVTSEVTNNGTEFKITVEFNDRSKVQDPKVYMTEIFKVDENVVPPSITDGYNDRVGKKYLIPHNPKGGEWILPVNQTTESGVYKTVTTINGTKRTIEAYGMFKPNSSGEQTFAVSVADFLGNELLFHEIREGANKTPEVRRNETLFVTFKDVKPITTEFIEATLKEGRANLSFTAPVNVTDPVDLSANPTYRKEIDTLNIFSNGDYNLEFSDIFGNTYPVDPAKPAKITVDFFTLSIDIDIAPTTPTNGNVIVTIAKSGADGATIKTIDGQAPESKDYARVEVTENRTVILVVEKGELMREYRIDVGNIDRVLAPVRVEYEWEDGDPRLNGQTVTYGNVTAKLLCDGETIYPVEGFLDYTFVYGGDTTHTFKYKDVAGNVGTLDVSLPDGITIGQKGPAEDKEAPTYDISASTKTMGVISDPIKFSKSDKPGEEELALTTCLTALNASKSQGVILSFKAYDQNAVTLITKGALPAGVTLTGMTLNVTANAKFTVWLKDVKGNEREIPLEFTQIDSTPPTATVLYKLNTLTSSRAYLIPSTQDEGDFFLVNTAGCILDEEEGSPYKGRYYHIFEDNGSFVFSFRDSAGNTGNIIAAADNLDLSPPSVVEVSILDTTKLQLTNKDVVYKITFDKVIKEIAFDGKDQANLEASLSGNVVTVIYKENVADVKITATAVNGRSLAHPLPNVTAIDKVAPVISNVKIDVAKDKKSGTITFDTSEDTFFETSKEAKKTHSKLVSSNGNVILVVSDKAGNSKTRTFKVDTLDLSLLKVEYSTDSTGKDPVSSLKSIELNKGQNLYVKSNKDAQIYLNEKVAAAATANSWTAVAIPANDNVYTYFIKVSTAFDGSMTGYLNFKQPDITPPTLILKSQTLSVLRGTGVEDIKKVLTNNIDSLFDDDKTAKPVVTFNDLASIAKELGIKTITYTATDAAGNKTTKTASLFVADENMPTITVNNTIVYGEATTVVRNKTATIEISNLKGQPFNLYYKKDIKTEGQMKIGATQAVTNNIDGKEYVTIDFTSSGFYTLYFVTQDRKSVITYLYVQ